MRPKFCASPHATVTPVAERLRTTSATSLDLPRPASAEIADDPSCAAEHLVHVPREDGHLGLTPDHRERVPDLPLRRSSSKSDDAQNSDRLGLALDGEIADELTLDPFAQGSMHLLADVDVAWRSLRHQPGREVDRVPEACEGSAHRMAVRAAANPAVGDSDLQIRRCRFSFQRQQLDRRRGGPRGVVLVGVRRAEHGAQIRTLVSEDHMKQVATELREDLLDASCTKWSSFCTASGSWS